MATKKTPFCFRLSDEAVQALVQLDGSCLGYRSMTDVVEQAILELWERKLGLGSYDDVPVSLC